MEIFYHFTKVDEENTFSIMKYLKWLKRDTEEAAFVPTTDKKNVKLNRNESYLRALAKFAKWRQMQLSSTSTVNRRHIKAIRPLKGHRLRSSTSSLARGSFVHDQHEFGNCQAAIYEEILLEADNATSRSADELQLPSSDPGEFYGRRYCNSVLAGLEALENTVQEYSNNLQISSLNSQSAVDHKEPEYAMPYEFGDGEETTAECSSGAKLMVTDLDKSHGLDEINDKDEEVMIGSNMEFIKCSLKDIKTSNIRVATSQIVNGHLKNGEIDAIEISYLQMKSNCPNFLTNNFNILKKLRHPNIFLLMGMTVNKENQIMDALIFESFTCTLYEKIHNMAHSPIPLELCHKYAVQLTNAVLYLHRCSIIHTNICSQNIIVCDNAIKLTGFEFHRTIDGHNDSALCEERNMNSLHFFQAPELFDELQSKSLSWQTDVYGICITLWEMLNCIIPYAQFTRQELSKVFTLQNTQLPVYEKQRHQPYAQILNRGLQNEAKKRYANIVDLKQELREVVVSKHYDYNCPSLALSLEHGEEFTSTMKKRKTSPAKVPNYELTPNKRYSVNIIINSKHSPAKCQPTDKYLTETTTKTMGATLFESCESFDMNLNNSLPLINNYQHNKVAFEKILTPRYSLDPQNSRKRRNTSNNFHFLSSMPAETEDFFIDDDFTNDLNLESHLRLNNNNSACFK